MTTETHYEFQIHVCTPALPDWWLTVNADHRCNTVDDAEFAGREFMMFGEWRIVRVTTRTDVVKEGKRD